MAKGLKERLLALLLIFERIKNHDTFLVDFQNRPGCAADADGYHFQQSGERQHHRFQALARRVRRFAVPEPAPARCDSHRSRHRYASGLQVGTGVRPVATERIHTQGNLQQTGNKLDVAIQGDGFLQVLMPDGTTAYTRDGSFQTDSQGQMVTANGFPVQPAITIPANATSVTIRPGRYGVGDPARRGRAGADRQPATGQLYQSDRAAKPGLRTCMPKRHLPVRPGPMCRAPMARAH